jgi:hypothetical protein
VIEVLVIIGAGLAIAGVLIWLTGRRTRRMLEQIERGSRENGWPE